MHRLSRSVHPIKQIDVRFVMPNPPSHIDRRAEYGDAIDAVGLLDGNRVVAHAEVIGHEWLSEQVPVNRWFELELKEFSVEIINDNRAFEGDPTRPVGDQPLLGLALRKFRAALASQQAFIVSGRVAIVLDVAQRWRA